eukprot:916660-Rhodomonas_salina.2
MTVRMSQCFSASTDGAKSPRVHRSTICSSVMQSVKMVSDLSVSARTSTSAAPPISPRATTRSPLTWNSKLSPGSSLKAPAPTNRAFFPSSVTRSCRLPSVHASSSARPTFGLDGWLFQYWWYSARGWSASISLGLGSRPVQAAVHSSLHTPGLDCHTHSAPGGALHNRFVPDTHHPF